MNVIGWDIGGAHLKLARAVDGRILEVRQVPCALWLGLDRLEIAIKDGLSGWPTPDSHAITMTGELTDLFPDRAHGVCALVHAVEGHANDAPVTVYATDGTFLCSADATTSPERVASANWHASATLVAAQIREGLFVDVGSTTTDLVPFRDGRVVSTGSSDADRLASDELIYRGVVRTPVMAVVRHVVLDGQRLGVMAEYFATMADVYRLTGELPAHADQHSTADGRGKSRAESRARLARMIGRDAGDAPPTTWDRLAAYIAQRQLDQIHEGAARVVSAAGLPPEAPVIGAGVGRFLAMALADRLHRRYRGFDSVISFEDNTMPALAADCAPAAAVALLLSGSTP